MSAADRFDAIVIGAGVAGSLIAWRLGESGLKVAMLEAGAAKVDRPAAVAAYGASASKSLGSPYPDAAPGPEHPGPLDAYYDLTGSPERYLSTYERIGGGTTWHWLGHTPRLLPADFKMKEKYGVGVDWPISYEELEPWYCKAETALGVAGDDASWANIHGATRSQPFPMPQIWPSWSDNHVASAINGLVIDNGTIQILATPAARNSRPYDGRPPCAGNASCIPICPIGAKYDGSVHLGKALKTGNVELIAKAIATRLVIGRDKRIEAVEYRLANGAKRRVQAKVVVLAANAIESSKLLLLSADAKRGMGKGAANSSGQVGRNLMDHMQKSVFVRTKDPVYPFRGPPSTAGIETFRDGAFRAQRSAMRFSLNNDGWKSRPSGSSPAADFAIAISAGLFGASLRARVFESVSRQLRISLSTEVLPDPDNRVTLSDMKDVSGIPRPRIHFSVGQYTRDAFGPALGIIAKLVRGMNGTIVEQDASVDPGHYNGAGHVMGGCRMGKNRGEAVTDSNARSFDHPNLYIAGAALWPTCGTANPTLTIAALGLRAAERIITNEFHRKSRPLP